MTLKRSKTSKSVWTMDRLFLPCDIHETFPLSSRDGSAYFLTFKLIQRNFRATRQGGGENVYHSVVTITYFFPCLSVWFSFPLVFVIPWIPNRSLSCLALEFSLCDGGNWLRIEPIERKEKSCLFISSARGKIITLWYRLQDKR